MGGYLYIEFIVCIYSCSCTSCLLKKDELRIISIRLIYLQAITFYATL